MTIRTLEQSTLTGLLGAVARWYRRRQLARQLGQLSDRLLADIGLERETIVERLRDAEAAAMANRPQERAARHATAIRGAAHSAA